MRFFLGAGAAGAAAAAAAFFASARNSGVGGGGGGLFPAHLNTASAAASAATAEGHVHTDGAKTTKKRRDMYAATGHIGAATATATAGPASSSTAPPEGSYFVLREDGSVDRLAKWDKGWSAGRTKFHKEEVNPVL